MTRPAPAPPELITLSPTREDGATVKQRGICPVCGVERFVTWAGGMWNHKGDIWAGGRRLKCAGVGRPPAPTVHEGGTHAG